MSIRVGKYDYKNKVQPGTPGYTNVLIHTTGDLSPYTMRDESGVIMENVWQFGKCWEKVYKIKQPISRYNHATRWEHGNEVHFEQRHVSDSARVKDGKLTDAYWAWRDKGMHHNKWVRYPNGYKHHHEAIGSVIGTPDDYEIVGYIEARKRIYFPKYREIAIHTKQFKELQQMLLDGINIQINEVDGCQYMDLEPYDKVVNGSLEMTPEVLRQLINQPTQAFGHGFALAACLMGVDLTQ